VARHELGLRALGRPAHRGRWSYQWIAQLDFAPDSWTAPLDARRIRPEEDATAVTIEQIQELIRCAARPRTRAHCAAPDIENSLLEVTVDPGRDTSERMAAYAKLTGVVWALLTASSAMIAALWYYFGTYYQVVPEGSPAGIDWESGRPYTYDVDHSDGFIVIDPTLHERFVAARMVSGATVPSPLRHLLDAQGVYDLKHPGGGS